MRIVEKVLYGFGGLLALILLFIAFCHYNPELAVKIGADLKGILISFIAAMVPTALLIAETYILSSTKYKLFVCDELMAKLDKND